MNRQELLTTAATVGLVLGVDFGKNISNENLQKKIEEKQEQLADELKSSGNTDITPPTDEEIKDAEEAFEQSEKTLVESGISEEKAEQIIEELLIVDEVATKIKDENKITDKETIEDEEDNALIMRKTECFTYRTEIIGFKETARRSNLTVEEVKEAIETGKPAGGYIFEFVG